ncbi:DJ-1/PfpI family protein [Flavobacterium sp.]|uniref:DJ-1/PfpI family protein n=1 Tax=Flavobacterium sp. TaxID=239 RepID=UPI003D6B50A2
MKLKVTFVCLLLTITAIAQHNSKPKEMNKKTINPNLPTIGILIFEGFLTNEVTAPLDVFTKKDTKGEKLFNVILIAKEDKMYLSEEGLNVHPDYTIYNTPKLNVLVVPSSMNPEKQTKDPELINFIRQENKTTDYMASHCAGAFMLGESGVADGKQIVTYCSGSKNLQKEYPKLVVQDDTKVKVVKDGKIISSNGNLVSYIASLDLLEEMISIEHRKHVEEELLIDKLCK